MRDDEAIYCPTCHHKMTLLLISAICDYCNPPNGATAKTKEINWWEGFWWSFIGGVNNPALSKLNKPVHSSNIGNLTNGKVLAAVLFWPKGDDGSSKEAIVFDTRSGGYQKITLMAPADEAEKMPGFAEGGSKYIHSLTPSTPTFGKFADKWERMILLMNSEPPKQQRRIIP